LQEVLKNSRKPDLERNILKLYIWDVLTSKGGILNKSIKYKYGILKVRKFSFVDSIINQHTIAN